MSNINNRGLQDEQNLSYVNVAKIKSAGQYAKLIVWWVVLQLILGGILGANFKRITEEYITVYLVIQALIMLCILYSINGMANDLINVDTKPSVKEEMKSLNKMLEKGIISQDQFNAYMESIEKDNSQLFKKTPPTAASLPIG